MTKNVILTILCLCSMQTSSASFIEQYLLPGLFYFDFGFNLGVKPYMWAFIPHYALGNGLKYIPQENKAAAYLLGVVGCLSGTIVVYSAIACGIKKLSSPKINNNDSNNIKIEQPQSLNEEIKNNQGVVCQKYPYARNYNHSP